MTLSTFYVSRSWPNSSLHACIATVNKKIEDMKSMIDATAILFSSEDLREEAIAFLEKREPVWKGK